MGRRKGSLNKTTLASGKRTRAAVKAGRFPAPKPGRPGGAKTRREPDNPHDSRIRDRAEALALLLIESGANPNEAAVAAVTEVKDKRGVIRAVEAEMMCDEAGPWVPIEGKVPPSLEELANLQPDFDLDDLADCDGSPERWVSPLFAKQKGRRVPKGRIALAAAGIVVEPHKGISGDVEAVAKRIRPAAKAMAEASLRAAEAYCKAIEQYAERHGFKRTPDDWGGWRFDAS